MSASRPVDITYVLPLRWTGDEALDDLTAYLAWLSEQVDEVVVVDGSDPERFRVHGAAWQPLAGRAGRRLRHLPPDPAFAFRNGKVSGVSSGLRAASRERVVVADDDVRYDRAGLGRMATLLLGSDLVRPQNHFGPPPGHAMPWHARWDTARTLLNRAVSADYPGTLGLRRSAFLAMGGYDGDVLFENLELIRTVRASNGSVMNAPGLFVARRPPTAGHFRSQRVRQAYDDLAIPARMTLFLAVAPAVAAALARRRWGAIGAGAAGCIALAEVGRRRHHGRRVFPASCALFAPAWVLERGVCAWLALASRLLRGGCRYGDVVIRRAATPMKELSRRHRASAMSRVSAAARRSAVGAEADHPVRAVAEGPGPGVATPAQRHGPSPARDLVAVLIEEGEPPAHDQRTIAVRGDFAALHRRSPRRWAAGDIPWDVEAETRRCARMGRAISPGPPPPRADRSPPHSPER